MYYLLKIPRYSVLLTMSMMLYACKVGPNFHSPVAPQTKQFIHGHTPTKTAASPLSGKSGKAQYFKQNQKISAQWWRIYHSKELNHLIDTGLRNSPNLAAAKAALLQAQANYAVQFGNLFPAVAGSFTPQREKFSATEFGSSTAGSNVFNLYTANVTVAYTLDVFGGIRRQIEAAGAQIDYQRFELEAAFLTLSSSIVTTAITIASLNGQIEATKQLIKTQENTLSIVRQQRGLGGASQADVLLQETTLEQTKATLPPLQQARAQSLHALSALIGELPQEDTLPKFNLSRLSLPKDIPLSCPSSLVRQRPDIRAAEATLHAASAQIGVAIANLFPQITLNGNYGWQSNVLGALFHRKHTIWDIAAEVAQPIFNGGALIAKKHAAIAAYQQAAAQYKQTVIQAFQNVADTLRALEHDALLLKAQQAAEASARASLTMTTKQFRLGGVSYLALLTAQRTYQQALISRIQAQAARYTDTAALFQALGGGWWNRPPMACNLVLAKNTNQYKPECFH